MAASLQKRQKKYAAGESSTEPVYVTNVNEAKNGVVQVNYVYVDDNEKSHIVKGGTGFLIYLLGAALAAAIGASGVAAAGVAALLCLCIVAYGWFKGIGDPNGCEVA
ncbi:hypothetical protein bpr_IV018 (plasmid) [Butyrivibrio proteoclasticus B316]|uniref:Uncharacterized protein n=1 Tax=Butyrivibrio proteoclasticus (strain ATCC 51982 / DSM 14932 / B316) TaxID=515622 RepID=E0S4Q1_BUTPB|nr:hypothetical protein [Butyrivibrio proteoclasticus]ADL36383.1 hypothetical protein bpr_IV018 [Butyrivibrio proteoclasticus B316]